MIFRKRNYIYLSFQRVWINLNHLQINENFQLIPGPPLVQTMLELLLFFSIGGFPFSFCLKSYDWLGIRIKQNCLIQHLGTSGFLKPKGIKYCIPCFIVDYVIPMTDIFLLILALSWFRSAQIVFFCWQIITKVTCFHLENY